jgi:hypothetical protein
MTFRSILVGLGILISADSLFAQQATYTLKPTPKTVAWGYYDAKAAPVLRIRPELGGLCPAKRAIL